MSAARSGPRWPHDCRVLPGKRGTVAGWLPANGWLVAFRRYSLDVAGHDEGAENWACIASLIETCKLNGVDPQAYFADVLTRLVNLWPAVRIDELMPGAWAAQRAANKLAA
jgi:hypothetical protein